ncbi:glutathione S-transferase family protein [uncultured Methylobacterium sp.]|jgi:glutathione S-transferase|uniref:glutathione S-transferase family protein n=1 Tax=uncultured Methylobacterium sp. TaxID=157278 RepID=UPI002637C912|nr:glutathione S-transferase family protein [uncultured Methylobacterium sp.]
MSAPILHHYDFSPFSEKVRLAFGHKGLDWHAVETPAWPPKPDLVPLTAGYRRAPVLQVGADVYCDTHLILREIERRHPAPTLYPGAQVGLAEALSWWAERTTFMQAATLATSILGDAVPAALIEERKTFMRHDFGVEASLREQPLNRQRLHASLSRLADMLRDGRPFLLGAAVSAADLAAYHPIWFARTNGGAAAEAMLPLDPLRAWMDRVAALGHGRRHAMSPADALAAARAAEPEPVRVADADPSGLRAGQAVAIGTDDTSHDPIRGILVGADAEEVVIRHAHERVGTVHVHFPRAGYEVTPA